MCDQEPADRQTLLLLQNIFASLYRTNDRALELAEQAGLDVAAIPQSPRPRSTWWSILTEADRQIVLRQLIALAQRDYPRHEGLRLAAARKLVEIPGPELTAFHQAANHEAVIGQDDFLPVEFLSVGATLAASVVRINVGPRQYGSGFLIAPDLVLTNHHVLPTIDVARRAIIEVGCEETLAGIAIQGVNHTTRAEATYLANEANDWAVVRIEPVVDCTPISLSSTARPALDERVFIIQHPGGGPKQVAIGDNTVTFVSDERIQYLTDTRPGSSGSPVFDRRWRLVGVHHAGGWLSIPGSKDLRFQNEAIPIAIIRDALVAAGLIANA